MGKTPIKDIYNRTIGYIEELPNGDQLIRNFYMQTLGKYDKAQNVTKDFYGRTIAKGNQISMLLAQDAMKSYNKNTNKDNKNK